MTKEIKPFVEERVVKHCEQCSALFEGGKLARFCPSCRAKIFKSAGIKGNPKKAVTKPKTRKKREDSLFSEEKKTWTVEFIRTRQGWIWKAKKGENVTLESAGFFYSISGAKKDYDKAIGG